MKSKNSASSHRIGAIQRQESEISYKKCRTRKQSNAINFWIAQSQNAHTRLSATFI